MYRNYNRDCCFFKVKPFIIFVSDTRMSTQRQCQLPTIFGLCLPNPKRNSYKDSEIFGIPSSYRTKSVKSGMQVTYQNLDQKQCDRCGCCDQVYILDHPAGTGYAKTPPKRSSRSRFSKWHYVMGCLIILLARPQIG